MMEESGGEVNIFGKRLYSSSAANRRGRDRVLKMKQVQIKNMDLAGI